MPRDSIPILLQLDGAFDCDFILILSICCFGAPLFDPLRHTIPSCDVEIRRSRRKPTSSEGGERDACPAAGMRVKLLDIRGSAKLLKKPDFFAQEIGRLPNQDTVLSLGDKDNGFCKVQSSQGTGWVADFLVARGTPVPDSN